MSISYPPIPTPGRLAALSELRLPLDLLLSVPSWLRLPRKPVPQPRTVVLMPGFGWSERSMAVISSHLKRAGHRVHPWGLGKNTGDVPRLLKGLEVRTSELIQEAGEPLVTVGWSLGGYLARESARNHPDRFHKVVTLGSPVVGGPKFTVTAHWYRARGFDVDRIEANVAGRYANPLQVPVAAIYSKRDGVVAWQACIDHWSPDVRHVEVSTTHLGLTVLPTVLAIVADELSTV